MFRTSHVVLVEHFHTECAQGFSFLGGDHQAESISSQGQSGDTDFTNQGRLTEDWFDPCWCSFHLQLTPPL